MKSRRLPLRQAGLCMPAQVEDEELRSNLQETFGEAPVLVVSVSNGTFQSLQSGPRRGMLSAALRVSDHGCFTVVLVLQFNALQLRSVASLGQPMIAELLKHAHAHESINVLVVDEDGDGSGAMQLPFDERDVAMLMAAVSAQTDAGSEFRIVDAAITAADCRDLNELPSMFPDFEVEHVEVSVVALRGLDDSSGGSAVKGAISRSSDLANAEIVHEGKRFPVH